MDDGAIVAALADGGTLALPARSRRRGAELTLGVRPEHLHLGGGAARLTGQVLVVELSAAKPICHVRIPARRSWSRRGHAAPGRPGRRRPAARLPPVRYRSAPGQPGRAPGRPADDHHTEPPCRMPPPSTRSRPSSSRIPRDVPYLGPLGPARASMREGYVVRQRQPLDLPDDRHVGAGEGDRRERHGRLGRDLRHRRAAGGHRDHRRRARPGDHRPRSARRRS